MFILIFYLLCNEENYRRTYPGLRFEGTVMLIICHLFLSVGDLEPVKIEFETDIRDCLCFSWSVCLEVVLVLVWYLHFPLLMNPEHPQEFFSNILENLVQNLRKVESLEKISIWNPVISKKKLNISCPWFDPILRGANLPTYSGGRRTDKFTRVVCS